MEAVQPYIDAVLPHVEAAKEARAPVHGGRCGATGDAAGYMYGAAKEATIAGMEAAAAQAEAVRPHVEELAGSISLNPLTPIFEQDFVLPVLASLLWFFVFDCFTGVQVMTMHGTSAHRFSYDGNPRWEVADRSVLNLLEQTPLFLPILWPTRSSSTRTSRASSACAPSARGSPTPCCGRSRRRSWSSARRATGSR